MGRQRENMSWKWVYHAFMPLKILGRSLSCSIPSITFLVKFLILKLPWNVCPSSNQITPLLEYLSAHVDPTIVPITLTKFGFDPRNLFSYVKTPFTSFDFFFRMDDPSQLKWGGDFPSSKKLKNNYPISDTHNLAVNLYC
jgi:hypothetical protein